MLAVLPWLDPWLLVPAAPVALLLARWTARRGRGLVALGTIELQLASLVFYVALNERLYGGFTPLSASEGSLTGATSAGDYAGRLPRLAELWVDRDVGLLRWAPVLALAFLGAWLLWRSRRERLARLISEQRDAEHAAFLALAVCAAQVAVAVFVARDAGGAVVPGDAARGGAAVRGAAGGLGAAARAAGRVSCWARSRWARARGWCSPTRAGRRRTPTRRGGRWWWRSRWWRRLALVGWFAALEWRRGRELRL